MGSKSTKEADDDEERGNDRSAGSRLRDRSGRDDHGVRAQGRLIAGSVLLVVAAIMLATAAIGFCPCDERLDRAAFETLVA
jgi:hypothetical protein